MPILAPSLPFLAKPFALLPGDGDARQLEALKSHFAEVHDAVFETRRHLRARRLTLRVKQHPRKVVVTLPKRAARREAHALVSEHYDWIIGQLSNADGVRSFRDGQLIPFRGTMHRIRFCLPQRGRGVVSILCSGPELELLVAGQPEFCPRRLAMWLKGQARQRLEASVRRHAESLGVAFKRISVRDQTSRWGSCSTTGTLSFSWRLILAPDHVLDYVAAHEVAHLIEMNHSIKFWALVCRLDPDFKAAEAWLSSEGRDLHRYTP